MYTRSFKVELHVHLDGSFDPELLHSYIESTKDYDSIPEETINPWDETKLNVRRLVQACQDFHDFQSLCCCRGKMSLQEMIKCFEIFTPIARGNLELIEKLAYDFVKRQSQQNVIYTEVRYSPHLLATGGALSGTEHVDAEPVADAITRGLRQGEIGFHVKVNQIICCLAWRPDWADDVIRIANERKNQFPCAVVGVDIASGEEHFDKADYPNLYSPHIRAFERGRKLNLNVTMHAGEVGKSSNIKTAVEKYGASRIGHGYKITSDPELMHDMRRKDVHFEVCPISSVETGGWKCDTENGIDWKKHPAVSMINNGLKVGFNSDDPAVFNTSITQQLWIASDKMGLEKHCIYKSVKQSVDGSFLSKSHKLYLQKTIEEFMVNHDSVTTICFDDFSERVIGYQHF